MRRPPIKIVVRWVAQEIIKAGAYSEVRMVMLDPNLTGSELLDQVLKIVQHDRLSLTDANFRQVYVNYIRRTAP